LVPIIILSLLFHTAFLIFSYQNVSKYSKETISKMDFKTTKLNNGMRIIMSRNPNITTATIMVYVNVGLNWEPDNINGIAHFVEHMFFKGTTKRPTQLIIASELSKYGASKNAYTSEEHTCYHIHVVDKHLEPIIEILGDIITNSLYRSKDIEIEKDVVINEIHQRKEGGKSNHYFYQNFFKGLPLSRDIAGEDSNIRKINRSMVLAFLNKFYTPDNMVISVAGNFPSFNWLKSKLKKNFDSDFHNHYIDNSKIFKNTIDDIDEYKNQWEPILKLAPTPSINNFNIHQINRHYLPDNKSPHTVVKFGFIGVKYNDLEKRKARMLIDILGGGMESRLFQDVRNKHGLVYRINSDVEEFDFNGIIAISYSCNHDIKTQYKILELIKKNIEKLKNEPVTQEEYENIISCYENENRKSLSDSYNICSHYGFQCLKKDKSDIYTLPQIIEQYKSVTISDLHEFAKKLFDWNKFIILSISPVKIPQKDYTDIFTNPYKEKYLKSKKEHQISQTKKKPSKAQRKTRKTIKCKIV
jgi:predicted Zn-dependent peptidase